MNANSLLARLAPAAAAGLVFLSTATPAMAQNTTAGDVFKNAGPVGWCIMLLSIVALAVIIENMTSLKRDKLAPPELIDEIEVLFNDEKFQEAMDLCEEEETYFTRVCGAGISKIGHPYEVVEKSLEEMGDEESIKLHQKIGWLSLIANVAPMMGLLGTVMGMVTAFNEIARSQGQANPADLAAGISQALLTTMLGLIVAIPVTAAFAFLRNRLIKTIIETGAIVEDLFERFRPQT
ncbi:MAG: MotA/TolQ/ExbB proton channel family protein [Planctomycetes bacterium]|jgi:biopolymer transport protein ExbB|nr:MotA/TolQ/ExbB proton channel family protein [Planctomycetota bacterium]